jgi:hypothetical protein
MSVSKLAKVLLLFISGSFTAARKLFHVAQSPTVAAHNNLNIRVSCFSQSQSRERIERKCYSATLPDNACPEKLIGMKKAMM